MGQRPPDQPLLGIAALIVEDDEDARYVMNSYLTYFGAHVLIAANGAEALRHLQNVRADVIVTDMSMPGMDGLQLFEEVRKLPGLGGHPKPAIRGHLKTGHRE